MDIFPPLLIIDGIVLGLTLSLIAAGLTMIYGLAGVLNISHGELVIISTVTAAVLLQFGSPLPLALLAGLGAAVALSSFLERVVLRPIYGLEGEERVLLGLYITLALAIFLHSALVSTFPLAYLTLSLPIPTVSFLGLTFRTAQLLSGGIAATTLVALFLFLKRSWSGMAIRSLTQNEVGALICGVSVKRYRLLVFIIGGVLASSAGYIRGLVATVGPETGLEFTILALLVCVVGGVRSVYGTIIAGIVIGVVYTFLIAMIGTYLANVALLVFIMLLVLIKPYGIIGERW